MCNYRLKIKCVKCGKLIKDGKGVVIYGVCENCKSVRFNEVIRKFRLKVKQAKEDDDVKAQEENAEEKKKPPPSNQSL